MKFSPTRDLLALCTYAFLLASCVHTPPGTSVELALAKRPEVVRLPTPPEPPAVANSQRGAGARYTAVEPDLPTSDVIEKVADAYSRGQFCMKTGNDAEAIQAFREVVEIDPKFADAWHNLAALYEKTGQDEKALDAFRRSKNLVQQ